MTTSSRMAYSAGQLETALIRTAVGDQVLEEAVGSVARSGIGLPALLAAGLIAVEPDVDELGGGCWAEIDWLAIADALTAGRVRATPPQAAALLAAVTRARSSRPGTPLVTWRADR